jgi:altronate hydrolase
MVKQAHEADFIAGVVRYRYNLYVYLPVQAILQIHTNDTVAVALQPLAAGTVETTFNLQITSPVAQKQKVLLHAVAKDEAIIMYGVKVGRATKNLQKGTALTQADIVHDAAAYSSAAKEAYQWLPPSSSMFAGLDFNGYHRSNGKVGTRNFWLVVPLVFCENQNIQTLQTAFEKALGYSSASIYEQRVQQLVAHQMQGKDINDFLFEEKHTAISNRPFKNVDGIKFLTHQMGCGGSRADAKTLCKLIAGYINHPNVGGATVLSLGCQNATIEWLKAALQTINPDFDKPLYIIDQQQAGGNTDLLNAAIDKTFEGLVQINRTERQAAPFSQIVLGLKCGGSDGFSGISANPALGYASDILVGQGGSSILAEFPELCGVEQQLINRFASKAEAQKFEILMRDYAALSESFGNPFHMNPSEGNIKDGLLTDAMKSAGAARKGGDAIISGVLDYTEQLQTNGLHLLCTPGNDVEATTGIAGSGATITVFTTGLGTPTGNPISPMLKVSSNTNLYNSMPDVIDFDCGGIITGTKSIAQCGEALLKKIVAVANGELTKAELLGQNDFIPWRKSISV